ncbi:MAG: hypothetical protein COV43_02070 [Deltaproteobacteria bacterium CG11_big_fil_rev_8_21_14_0_20_42_23]|nr:MAG: hypothetical protein COV43_02070 [Deltaproteobacteria bacterium CG11_big_fil_rev_8_21_14_0_20_42_23]PJC64211.1 MAG: hypothetical protein CO021_05470 [Deltaproteobacteria bacterium CG_4_9_14_0_2_um_filter_42_21]
MTSTDRYGVDWNEVEGEDYYILEEDTDPNFSSPREVQIARNRSFEFIDQDENDTYSIRMKGVNDCGDGPWGNAYRFTLNTNHYPTRPIAITPVDGAVNVPLNTQVCWQSSHPDGLAIHYELYYRQGDAEDNTFFGGNLLYQGDNSCFTPPALEYGESYMWRVNAIDTDGSEVTSTIFRFTALGDNQAPTGSLQIEGGAVSTSSFSVNLGVVGNDQQSGVRSMSFSNDGQSWSFWYPFRNNTTWDLIDSQYGGSVRANNTYTVYMRLKDFEDNISPVYSDTIQKENLSPGKVTLNGTIYNSLKQAVALAEPGETVYLSPGEWHLDDESLVIHGGNRAIFLNLPAGVKLVGSGWENTRIVTGTVGYAIVMQEGSSITGITVDNNSGHAVIVPRGNNLIQHCRLTGAGSGTHGGAGIYIQDSNLPLSTVRNCILDTNYEAVNISGQNSPLKVMSSVITNNETSFRINYTTAQTLLANNIISYSTQYCHLVGSAIEQVSIIANDVFDDAYPDCYFPNGNGNLAVAPNFVDANARNYHLQNGSPMIDAGRQVAGLPFAGPNPDMGAYEFGASGVLVVNSGNSDARFSFSGVAEFNGQGENWQQLGAPAGLYSISYFPVENQNVPENFTVYLEPGATLYFNEQYTPDLEGPEGTVEVNLREFSTKDPLVTLRLLVKDNVAGIGENSQMRFSNDGQTWTDPAPFTPVVHDWDLMQFGGNANNGAHTVFARVSDNLGNWSSLITDEIQFLPTRPVLVVPDNYATIQQAFDAAASGDLVWLMPGEYGNANVETTLTIPDGVRLQGSGADVTFVHYAFNMSDDAQVDGATIDVGYPKINVVSAPRSIISNNIFLRTTRGIVLAGGNTEPVHIRNNILHTEFTNGNAFMFFSDGDHAVIENNTAAEIDNGVYSSYQHPLMSFYHNIFYNMEDLLKNQDPGLDYPTKLLLDTNGMWQVNTIFDDLGVGDETRSVEIYNMLNQDPLFTNAAARDYSLTLNSPFKNAGIDDEIYQDTDGSRITLGYQGGIGFNSRPTARLRTVTQANGTVQVDALTSLDAQDDASEMLVRWDLDGDGTFETPWEINQTKTLALARGIYTIGVQVRDRGYFVDTLSQQIVVANSAPVIASQMSPADNTLNVQRNTQLTWTATDPDLDALQYDLYFAAEGNALALAAQNLNVAQWNTPLLSFNTRYVWKIVAHDNQGAEVESPLWSFITVATPENDSDGDGVLNDDDAFPLDPTESADADGDGIGNNADTDDDNDGVLDVNDAFPLNAAESLDTDLDGIGNNADTDDDNDDILDIHDLFPLDASEFADLDSDGVGNNRDLCGSTPLGEAVDANGCSAGQSPLVLDGNMESANVDLWRSYGNPGVKEKSSDEFTDGIQSMHLNTIGTDGGIQQLNIPVEAGKWYEYSFQYKLNEGELRTLLGINSSNTDFEGKISILSPTNGNWISFSRKFQVPADYSSGLRIVAATRAADVYIDNVQLKETEWQNLLKDGNMEFAGVAEWRSYGNPAVKEKSIAEAVSGVQSIYLNTIGTNGGIQQLDIPVEPGRWYECAFQYKLTEGELRTLLGINSSNVDFEGKTTRITNINENWTQYTRQFRVPDNFTSGFRLVISTRPADVYLDNITIRPIPKPGLIIDGDMEAVGVGAWRSYASPAIKIKSEDEFVGGAQSMHINTAGGTGGMQQLSIPVEAGRLYDYTFQYKLNQGSLRTLLGIASSNADFEGADETLQSADGNWHEYTRQFRVPANFTKDFRLIFQTTNADTFIDEITLTPIEEEE